MGTFPDAFSGAAALAVPLGGAAAVAVTGTAPIPFDGATAVAVTGAAGGRGGSFAVPHPSPRSFGFDAAAAQPFAFLPRSAPPRARPRSPQPFGFFR